MKNRILAALAALTLFAGTASAQVMAWKDVQLQFVRAGNPIPPFPTASGNSNNGFYTGGLSNGGKAPQGAGVVNTSILAADTTQSIPIADHYFKRTPAFRAAAGGVLGSVGSGDTSAVFGILALKSTASTIDTIKVEKQISLDGLAWSTVDSVSASVQSISGTITIQPVAGDSCSIKLASVTQDINGNTIGAGAIFFRCNPFAESDNVTRLALVNVNYVRFIIWMTGGDQLNAGVNGGVYGKFSYPVGQYGQTQ
jgi:hypothetical protein